MAQKTSIDQSELKKFNKSFEEWWDPNGEFKTLHEINPIRISYITDKITEHFNLQNSSLNPLKNLSILDVGCGGGLVSVPIYKNGANVVGLDANKHNIKAATSYAKKNNLDIKFINTTIEKLAANLDKPGLGECYDVVLCLEVIEHVANLVEFLQNLVKLVKPGGLIIISTINRNIKSYFQAIVMAEYFLHWVETGTHDHAKFVKPSELHNMLKNGKKIKELKGLKFNLLTNKWYISDDINVNYFACIADETF